MTQKDAQRAEVLARHRANAAITFGPVPRNPDEPTRYALLILAGMQDRPVFAGIPPLRPPAAHPTKPLASRLIARRAKNRAARASRRTNRLRGI